MNNVYTVRQLKLACEKEILKGNGDKVIMLSNDDEGNGLHYLFFGFTPYDSEIDWNEDIDERIASKNKTIILG